MTVPYECFNIQPVDMELAVPDIEYDTTLDDHQELGVPTDAVRFQPKRHGIVDVLSILHRYVQSTANKHTVTGPNLPQPFTSHQIIESVLDGVNSSIQRVISNWDEKDHFQYSPADMKRLLRMAQYLLECEDYLRIEDALQQVFIQKNQPSQLLNNERVRLDVPLFVSTSSTRRSLRTYRELHGSSMMDSAGSKSSISWLAATHTHPIDFTAVKDSRQTVLTRYLIEGATIPVQVGDVLEYLRMLFQVSILTQQFGATIVNIQLLFSELKTRLLSGSQADTLRFLHAIDMTYRLQDSPGVLVNVHPPTSVQRFVSEWMQFSQDLVYQIQMIASFLPALDGFYHSHKGVNHLDRLSHLLNDSYLSINLKAEHCRSFDEFRHMLADNQLLLTRFEADFDNMLTDLIQIPLTVPDMIQTLTLQLLGEGQLPFDISKQYESSLTLPTLDELA